MTKDYLYFASVSFSILAGIFFWAWSARYTKAFNRGNKIVVVTGCDSGIGHEISKFLLSWGFKVISCCLDPQSHGAVALEGLGATILKLDLFDEETIENLATHLHSKELFCLINNAGVMSYAPFEWQTNTHIKSQIQVNLYGLVLVTKALLPNIRKAKGRIVNICSAQGSFGSPSMSIYCSSKGAVEIFSHALRREVAKDGISVVILRPCNLPLKTGILKNNAKQIEEMKEEMTQEARERNMEELNNMQQLFQRHFSSVELCQDLGTERLKKTLWEILTTSKPRSIYTAANLSVRMLLNIVPMLPTSFVDFLIKYEIHNRIISNSSD